MGRRWEGKTSAFLSMRKGSDESKPSYEELERQLRAAVELNQIREEQLREELARVDQVEAQCAAMREVLEHVAGGAWIDRGLHRANYSELMAVRIAREALAPNAGKALLVQMAAMRRALEAWVALEKHTDTCPQCLSRSLPICAVWMKLSWHAHAERDKALAPDAGKDILEDAQQWRNLRPTLQAFVVLMEVTLRRNDHKPPWQEVALDDLLERLYEEVDELAVEIVGNGPSDRIAAEAADVANFAMFIADVAGGLGPPRPGRT